MNTTNENVFSTNYDEILTNSEANILNQHFTMLSLKLLAEARSVKVISEPFTVSIKVQYKQNEMRVTAEISEGYYNDITGINLREVMDEYIRRNNWKNKQNAAIVPLMITEKNNKNDEVLINGEVVKINTPF